MVSVFLYVSHFRVHLRLSGMGLAHSAAVVFLCLLWVHFPSCPRTDGSTPYALAQSSGLERRRTKVQGCGLPPTGFSPMSLFFPVLYGLHFLAAHGLPNPQVTPSTRATPVSYCELSFPHRGTQNSLARNLASFGLFYCGVWIVLHQFFVCCVFQRAMEARESTPRSFVTLSLFW
eukprot:RCo007329